LTRDQGVAFARSCWLFLRLLGVVYFIAFVSLAVQIQGLVGERGILPVGEYLAQAHAAYGARAYLLWPTLVWFSQRDLFLTALCWGGAVTSLLLIAGIAPAASALVLWLFYLSLTIAGQVFLQFQWDALLLETGFLAILYAPLTWRSRLGAAAEPPAIVRWALWGLAFKLTVLSGITKILSGDPTWANLTALTYHYETQPIPAWTSWFMHALPSSIHIWSAAGMFGIELVVPCLIFAPARFRRVRLIACAFMSFLQIGIGVTGNYGFFNGLSIVLYLALLDDRMLGRCMGRVRQDEPVAHARPVTGTRWQLGVNVVAAAIVVLSALAFLREIDRTRGRESVLGDWPDELLAFVAPFHSVNGYGLFRVMTTERPEIVIEVSEDGTTWREYEFHWKAGDVRRRPRFVQPHMPRLDWQMWFAALDPRSAQGWLGRLFARLLDNDVTVMRLIGPPPVAGRVNYVRLAYYQYHFTTSAERAETRAWWRREFLGHMTSQRLRP
jgi:hypothetical protein